MTRLLALLLLAGCTPPATVGALVPVNGEPCTFVFQADAGGAFVVDRRGCRS